MTYKVDPFTALMTDEKHEALGRALKAANKRIADLEGALRDLIEHTLNCEFEIDVQMGLGNDAGAGMSDVLCKARAALKGDKNVHHGSN